MNNKFISMCKKSQMELKSYLKEELESMYKTVVDADGFLYAHGEFPVLLVAHMDTVHEKLPSKFEYDAITNSISSPQGIGGDDRCGAYMILEVIKRYNCSVLFCESEEVGGVGAQKFADLEMAQGLKFNYIIEFDRRGSNDAVFYDCDNVAFEKFITDGGFYKTAYGTFSDISVIAPALGVAAVNLSCGYYKEHTKDEYVALTQMEDSINAACDILAKTGADDVFEYVRSTYSGYYSGYGSYKSYDWTKLNDKFYYIEYIGADGTTKAFQATACSEEEAIGMLAKYDPYFSYSAVVDILEDEDDEAYWSDDVYGYYEINDEEDYGIR